MLDKITFITIFGMLLAGCVQEPISDFSIKYTRESGWKDSKEIIDISANGSFEYKLLDYDTDYVRNNVSGKLSESELKEFSTFVVRENNFFSLSKDLTVLHCFDAANEYIEVNAGGKSYKTGGYCVQNNYFRKIVDELYKYKTQFAK